MYVILDVIGMLLVMKIRLLTLYEIVFILIAFIRF